MNIGNSEPDIGSFEKDPRSADVFRTVIDDLGVAVVRSLWEKAKEKIAEGGSGILLTDGDEEGLNRVFLGIGAAGFVDFGHVSVEGMYMMTHGEALAILESIPDSERPGQ
jgi:hypothetical protein